MDSATRKAVRKSAENSFRNLRHPYSSRQHRKIGAGFPFMVERPKEFSENASNYYKIRRELQDIKDEFEWVEEVGEEE